MTGAVLCHDIIILYLHEDSTQNKIYVRIPRGTRLEMAVQSLLFILKTASFQQGTTKLSGQSSMLTCCQGSTRSVQENWSRHCTRTGVNCDYTESQSFNSLRVKVEFAVLCLLRFYGEWYMNMTMIETQLPRVFWTEVLMMMRCGVAFNSRTPGNNWAYQIKVYFQNITIRDI